MNFDKSYTKPNIKEFNKIEIEILNEIDNKNDIFEYKNKPTSEIVKIKNISKLDCTWKEVFHIKLDKNINYSVGSTIGIIAPNSDDIVNEILKRIKNLSNDINNLYVNIERTGLQSFKYFGKIFDFFKYKLDLSSMPRKMALLNLSKTTNNKNYLEYLASVEGWKEYCLLGVQGKSLFDIILENDCKFNLEDLLLNCDFIKPRHYSLINKSNENGEIILGIMETKKPINANNKLIIENNNLIKKGHVSKFISENFKEINELEITFKESILLKNIDSKNNILCFCTGTGITPFLSLYKNYPQKNIKLIYGFRNDEDNLFEKFCENESFLLKKAISSKKEYITDCINDDIVKEFIESFKDDINILICGNMKMQKTVFTTIAKYYPKLIETNCIFLDNWQ